MVSIYISLNTLELLNSPDLDPKSDDYRKLLLSMDRPFEELSIAATPFEIGQTGLFEHRGNMYSSFINKPNELHLMNVLNAGEHYIAAFTAHPSYPNAVRSLFFFVNELVSL